MPELLDLAKIKEYGIIGVICLVLLRYGGMLLKFVLDWTGIRLARRQTVEERLTQAENEIAILKANYRAFCEQVVDAATVMEDEMIRRCIDNGILRRFVARLKLAKMMLPESSTQVDGSSSRSPPLVAEAPS